MVIYRLKECCELAATARGVSRVTQQDIVTNTSLSFGTVQKIWHNRSQNISVLLLAEVAAYLEVPLYELVKADRDTLPSVLLEIAAIHHEDTSKHFARYAQSVEGLLTVVSELMGELQHVKETYQSRLRKSVRGVKESELEIK